MMNRRQMLKSGAAGLAGLALGTKLVGQDPQNWQPPTCQQEGLLGSYPYCYMGPYTQAAQNLYQGTINAAATAASALKNGTLTQAIHNNFISYVKASMSELSLAQTGIHDAYRYQYSRLQVPAKRELDIGDEGWVGNWCGDYGFDTNVAIDNTNAILPVNTGVTDPTLNQQVTSLGLKGSQDNIFNYTTNLAYSIVLQGNPLTPCGLDPAQLVGLSQGSHVSNVIGICGGTLCYLLPAGLAGPIGVLSGLFLLLGETLSIYHDHCRP